MSKRWNPAGQRHGFTWQVNVRQNKKRKAFKFFGRSIPLSRPTQLYESD